MPEPSLPISQETKLAIPDWAQILIWCGGLLLLLIIGFVVAMALRSDAEVSAFGKVATLLLVGLAAFIGLMGVLSFTSNYIGIIDAKQPFGLPEGTVRAILTIAFIVLVGVLSGYLVTNSSGRSAFSTNTRIVLQSYDAEADAINAADTTRRSFANEGLVTVLRSADLKKFEVVFLPRVDNRLSEDVAKQTLTMISTILAAMIGFYFAARGSTDDRGDAGPRSSLVAEIQGELSRNDFQGEIDKLNAIVKDKKPTADDAKSKLASASKELVDLQVELDKIRDLATVKSAQAKVPELESSRTALRGFNLKIDTIREKLQKIS